MLPAAASGRRRQQFQRRQQQMAANLRATRPGPSYLRLGRRGWTTPTCHDRQPTACLTRANLLWMAVSLFRLNRFQPATAATGLGVEGPLMVPGWKCSCHRVGWGSRGRDPRMSPIQSTSTAQLSDWRLRAAASPWVHWARGREKKEL